MKTRLILIALSLIMINISLFSQSCFICPNSNNSGGLGSSAFGTNNAATASYSVATGENCSTTGEASFVGGINSTTSGNFSFVYGQGNSVSQHNSFVFGKFSQVNGSTSFSIGQKNNVETSSSIAIGKYITTTRSNSIIIGGGKDEPNRLSCDVANSLAVGFESSLPTLFIGPASIPTGTGRVGIGNVTDPLAKFHIKADIDEPAIMFLEPSVWNNQSNVGIWMGNQLNGIKAEKNAGLVFKTEHFYVFNQGYTGFGTEEPAAKIHVKAGDIYIEDINHGIIMKSPDGTCWRRTLNDNGQLQFEVLEICPEDAVISVNDPIPGQTNIKIYPNPAGNNIEIEIPDLGDGPMTFTIMDGTGKILKSFRITELNTIVSIGEFPPGVYYGKVSGEGIYCVEKFIKY